ncbi:hemin ABC transporter substrate-binding protein [Zhouia sp. PK063]|uniref:hemin ABC transporter substrate-binding protein n=1 Tax=Zhouia sp. PK063 TaxID=3373602 RepID=UPI0037BAAB25
MKQINRIAFLSILITLSIGCKQNREQTNLTTKQNTQDTERIVSLNGTLTEILCDLGLQKNIVAVDVTSVYPASIKEKTTNLGHVKNLSMEALLKQKPTQIVAIENEISDPVKQQLATLQIPIHYYHMEYSVAGTQQLISQVAEDINSNKASALLKKIDQAVVNVQKFKKSPKVMFIYARGAGTLLVAGTHTPTSSMIGLAGGTNAVTQYEGYKPLTAEAVAQANPDILLLFDSGLQSLNGIEGLKNIPGINTTTAVKKEQIISMDGLLLTGFGPRVGEAIQQLHSKIAPYAE